MKMVSVTLAWRRDPVVRMDTIIKQTKFPLQKNSFWMNSMQEKGLISILVEEFVEVPSSYIWL